MSTMRARFRTTDDVKAANREAGRHFFDPATMRFFNSRVHRAVYGGRYFVTSERYSVESGRRYTVREILPDGDIETVGDFQQYATAAQARKAAWRLTLEIHPDA